MTSCVPNNLENPPEMPTRRLPSVLLRVLGLLPGMMVVGCGWFATSGGSIAEIDRSAVMLEYSMENPMQAVGEIETVSLDEDETQLLGNALRERNWTTARLRIDAPHPEGKEGYARAVLRLGSGSPTVPRSRFAWLPWASGDEPVNTIAPDLDDELWVLDLPREELDGLLDQIDAAGFFEGQTRPSTGVMLTVHTTGGRVEKEWSTEPVVEHLMTKIYSRGRLVGFAAAK